MKVVLGVPWYLPESIGGTEIFVHTLSAQLDKLGVDCAIMTPSMDGKTSVSSYSGIRVVRFPAMTVKDRTRYGILASQHSEAFTRLLEAESPDIYNQHEWSQNLGFSAFRAAKALKIPTIFTIHMGLIICRIQTLLYRNKVQCDGEIIEKMGQNEPHAGLIMRWILGLVAVFGGDYVRCQAPIVLDDTSEPEPDIVVTSQSAITYFRTGATPTAADVRIIVEVSMTSLAIDLGRKAIVYARAGIPELKYNMSILGVVRTGTTPGRGGAKLSTTTVHSPTGVGQRREL